MDAQGPDKARPFVERSGAQFTTVVDRENTLGQLYGFKAIPNGILVDEKGKGIAGSDVSVQGARTSGLMLFRNQNGAKTDAEGKFVIEGVSPGSGTVVVNGGAHLEAREDVEVRPGEMTKGVRLMARRGSTLTVTVLDEKGMPVVGAEVTAATPGSSGSIGNWRSGGSRRVTRSIRRERRNGHTVTVIDGDSEELGSAKTDENGVAVLRGYPLQPELHPRVTTAFP